ncbi:MAG: CoA transferase [Acidimicrobiales bacterium]|nr:CoA transferase [Acidimicrobiales bacterium]
MRATTELTGRGSFDSAFAVTRLAVESIALAAEAVADVVALVAPPPGVAVDRELASWWFAWSFRPDGWELPPVWDPIAGDHRGADSWIRLHTNAPRHRRAALSVLGWSPDDAPSRDEVGAVVRTWVADDLESAIVDAGGAAAAMRSAAAWAAHPHGRAVATEPLVHRTRTSTMGAGSPPPADRPLAGVRVLDLTRVLAGPVATRFLAGFGAEVLRVDPLDWDEPAVVPEVTLGKRCSRLDARSGDGRARLRRLLAGADVLVHGYRPGALDALLALDADARAEVRPGLVEVCLDAYGWTGPWSARRGFDSLVQMSAGIAEAGMRWAGREVPTPLPVQALDHATGYLLAAEAVDGLRDRWNTGWGSLRRASLARTAVWLTELAGDDGPPLADAPWGDATPETTPWGPGHRLPAPVTISGAPVRWDRGACHLGSADPEWPPARSRAS